MVVKILHRVLNRLVRKDRSPAKKTETEGSTEEFETPEMDEFLRENQTADEL